MPSLWVVVQSFRAGGPEAGSCWAVTVCNLDPEPEPVFHTTLDVATAHTALEVRQAWLDAGDGKGRRRWGCDVSGTVLRPGLNEVALLEVDGVEGREWKEGGWVGRLVGMGVDP